MKNYFKLSTLALALATTFTMPVFAEGFTNTIDGFTNNSDGTVTDTKTGLVWQACAVGQTFNAGMGNCDGTATTYSYADAMKLPSDFAGQSDWRVPNVSELLSIVDLRKVNPSINKSLFPNPPAVWFWSASVYAYNPSYAWIVSFEYGGDDYSNGYKNDDYAVRLVRGGQSFYFATLKLADFTDNKDGTVTNTKTGLTWQRCAVGQTWNDGYCDGTATAYSQADAAKLTSNFAGQSDWHLPSLRELQTIVDYTKFNLSTNLIIFPDAPRISNYFWTITPKAEVADNFWYVAFDYGASSYTSKTETFSARLVRGTLSYNGSGVTTPAETGNVDLVSTLSANPSPAKKGGDLTYTATITNKGTATATGAKVTFFVAPKFMSYTASSNGCELQSSGLSVVCTIGDLAAGANVTKTMTVNLKKAGGISSSVSAKANEKDANPTDNVGKVATGVRK
jgi:uncharacterized repeat protein (TIGR01451 family)